MAFCNNCGRELKPTARFCPICGATAPGMAGAVPPLAAQRDMTAQTAAKKRGFFGEFKSSVTDTLKHPLRLLPTIVLSVIWIVFSLLSALVTNTPVMRFLYALTYSNGGMYGGVLGAIGGIFGKAVFAAVVSSLVLSLFRKKKPSSGADSRRKGVIKKAASSGLAAIAPFLIGAGLGILLYLFFNVTSSP